MESWPKPPHYESPEVPEIPEEVTFLGERVETGPFRAPTENFSVRALVETVKSLVSRSEDCFQAILERLREGKDVEDTLSLLRRVHEKIFKSIYRLEIASAQEELSKMEVP